MNTMTVLSTEMFNHAKNEELTIKEAVTLLKEQAVFRTLKDKLMRFSKGRDIRPLIVEGLIANNPSLIKESVQRKVRGWFNNDERSIKKQEAIELCFILDLSIEEADLFLAMVSEEGFHWRNPEEIVYAFALLHKIPYVKAGEIFQEISAGVQKIQPSDDVYTALVKKEVMEIESVEDLKAYINQAEAKLGTYHNTAYALFMEYMNVLENPGSYDELPDEKKMSVREISENYLNEKMIPRFRKNSSKALSSLSVVERNLRMNWPDEFTISRIKNREIDVSRKILILLFLATDGAEYSSYGDFEDYDEYYDMDEEDVFSETYMRMSSMLKECGFAPLDPRVPFDWMILYCMCVSDSWDIDKKMKDFLRAAFDCGNEVQK